MIALQPDQIWAAIAAAVSNAIDARSEPISAPERSMLVNTIADAAIERLVPGSLKLRAVAALCALRGGPRGSAWLRTAIGDSSSSATRDLLSDLRSDFRYVALGSGGDWHLTIEGIRWATAAGLQVDASAVAAAREGTS